MPRREASDDEWERGERLGQAIARERASHKLSQETLARMADVRIDTLRAIERGLRADPSFFRVIRVVHALHLKADAFLTKYQLLNGGTPPRGDRGRSG